jgi:phosphatidylserine synthase 2
MLYLPDGMITRPTQLLWKAVTGFSMVYLMVLIVFVFLSKEQTQWLLRTFFDSSLGVPLPEKSYAGDCRLYIPNSSQPFKNIQDTLDIFVLAHVIGWFVKTLICRDLKLVLFQSVVFELLEVMFRHLLPNFYECWWDHVVLDIFGMNLLGIALGWWVIKKYNLERLKWSLRELPLKKTFLWNIKQFLSNSDVSHIEYKFLTSTKKYLQVTWFIIFVKCLTYSDAISRCDVLLQQVPAEHPSCPVYQRYPNLDDGPAVHQRQ